MRKYRNIFEFRFGVFDLDGTLVDSMPVCARIFAAIAEDYGVPKAAAMRHYRRTFGEGLARQFETIFTAHDVAHDAELCRILTRRFDERFLDADAAPITGATDLVMNIASDIACYLSSASSDACVEKRLGTLRSIRHRFALALGSTAYPKGTEHLRLFADFERIPLRTFARQAFFCGDGETDMRIAKDHGLYAIGVLGTASADRLRKAGADRVVASVRALLRDWPRARAAKIGPFRERRRP